MWESPKGNSEFDKYQVSISGSRRQQFVSKNDDNYAVLQYHEGLEAGKTYQVIVKTVSGKVTSWPATGEVTLKPLPVTQLRSQRNEENGFVTITFEPDPASTQEEYRITYHEVETLNGDASIMTTDKTTYLLESLLPGRNYSITVQAISKKVESNETTIFVLTRPSAPIIEDLKSIKEGLNISWKSDVNSRQDLYEIMLLRSDGGALQNITTRENRQIIKGLFPGAQYNIKVFAVSHGLKSEPHTYFQAVYPNPPRNMTIEKVTSNSVLVHWKSPEQSEFTEYSIRYRTESERQWIRLPSVNSTEADVTDMTPGEKYTIQVNTASHGVESPSPQQVNQTVRPNPVSNIIPLVDSTNITLEWPRPEGRVEMYFIVWWSTNNPDQRHTKNISEKYVSPLSWLNNNNDESGGGGPQGADSPTVRVVISDLVPGIEYKFDINTKSYNLKSDITHLKTRTMPLIQSEVFVVNNLQQRDTVTLSYTPTPQSISKFDMYRFSLGDSSIPDKEKSANSTERKVTFTGNGT